MKRTLLLALPCVLIGGHAEAQANNNAPPPPYSGFTQSEISSVSPSGLVVEVSTDCPSSNSDTRFRSWPLSVARVHGGGGCPTSTWTGLVTGDIWVNRCTTSTCTRSGPNPLFADGSPEDPNSVGGQSNLVIALIYSSINDADAATLAELDWWLGGSHWLSYTEAVGIPDSHVYTNPSCFVEDVTNGGCTGNTISMQIWPSSCSSSCNAVPSGSGASDEYVVMPPNKLTTDGSLQSGVVELDYERADNICDISGGSGENSSTCIAEQDSTAQDSTVSFLTQLASLLQNTSSLGSSELPMTYQFSVRGDELLPVGNSHHTNKNTWLSGLDEDSIPQIIEITGFDYYSIFMSDDNQSGSFSASWTNALSVVNGGTEPAQCSAIMAHIMMDVSIADTTTSDASYANELLGSGTNGWCVPYLQPDFTAGGALGGPNCDSSNPGDYLVWPYRWSELIGETFTCPG